MWIWEMWTAIALAEGGWLRYTAREISCWVAPGLFQMWFSTAWRVREKSIGISEGWPQWGQGFISSGLSSLRAAGAILGLGSISAPARGAVAYGCVFSSSRTGRLLLRRLAGVSWRVTTGEEGSRARVGDRSCPSRCTRGGPALVDVVALGVRTAGCSHVGSRSGRHDGRGRCPTWVGRRDR